MNMFSILRQAGPGSRMPTRPFGASTRGDAICLLQSCRDIDSICLQANCADGSRVTVMRVLESIVVDPSARSGVETLVWHRHGGFSPGVVPWLASHRSTVG